MMASWGTVTRPPGCSRRITSGPMRVSGSAPRGLRNDPDHEHQQRDRDDRGGERAGRTSRNQPTKSAGQQVHSPDHDRRIEGQVKGGGGLALPAGQHGQQRRADQDCHDVDQLDAHRPADQQQPDQQYQPASRPGQHGCALPVDQPHCQDRVGPQALKRQPFTVLGQVDLQAPQAA